MKLSLFGRFALALFASLTLGLGMTACGGGTIAFMWVLGQQYNQIAGFKVDDYTGNLTQIPHEPFNAGGTAPVSLVLNPGGRYLYVLNQGTLPSGCSSAATCTTHWTGGNISVFSVGGDGTLTFEQAYTSQGYDSQWLQLDNTGSYLYVLDQYSPSGDGNGSITAYSIDSSSGRLTLVQNTQNVTSCNSTTGCLTYFEVGSSTNKLPQPFMSKTAGNCLFIANHSNEIIPFSFQNGQLVSPTTATDPIQFSGTAQTTISSIGGNSSYLSITDNANNAVALYSVGSGCALNLAGGGWYSLATYNTADPAYTMIDSSGKYLYVLNQANTANTVNTTTPYSSVMAFIINSTNTYLEPIAGAPYGTGSFPVCMLEDPTNQYVYISNHNDGSLTGFTIDTTTGILAPLSRGSSFGATGEAECLAVSGSVN